MSDPVALLEAIETDCAALDSAAKELARMTGELADAELAYLDALDAALIQVEDEYRERGEKLPSEQQREARAHRLLPAGVRGRYLEAKRKVELIQMWGRMREKALSGRQSELSFLKAEGQSPSGPEPQWTSTRRRVA